MDGILAAVKEYYDKALEFLNGLGISADASQIVEILLLALLILFALFWLFLPFAIFGTKKRLDKMNASLERANDSLEYSNRVMSRLLSEIDQPERGG